jgi:SAM-dependent methyltransferase
VPAVSPISFKSVLFRFSPLARKFLPKWALRFLLLKVLQTNQRYAGMYEAASRLCLERELLPWLAQHYGRILFVGTSSYTFHYEEQFRRDQYTTIDVQPRNAVWGAADHIVAPIEEIGRHRPAASFDCIVLNGVFGFGVDDDDHMRRVIEALHTALRPQGFLVVGWNTNLHADPAPLLAPYFVANSREPWVQRRTFPPETHVYDFLQRRADQ